MGAYSVEIGVIHKTGNGQIRGELCRTYADHTPAEVWAMLTEPGKMALWLAPGEVELREGGAVKISFEDSGIVIDSSVLAFEPERVLAYSWSSGAEPERPLRWEIKALEGDVQLKLTVDLPESEDIAKACAGFEGHLEMLGAALEDVPVKFPLDLYLRAREEYTRQLEG